MRVCRVRILVSAPGSIISQGGYARIVKGRLQVPSPRKETAVYWKDLVIFYNVGLAPQVTVPQSTSNDLNVAGYMNMAGQRDYRCSMSLAIAVYSA